MDNWIYAIVAVLLVIVLVLMVVSVSNSQSLNNACLSKEYSFTTLIDGHNACVRYTGADHGEFIIVR